MNLEKRESMHSQRPTIQNPNFESMDQLENVISEPTVENKMGNSHEKGRSHFKLSIND